MSQHSIFHHTRKCKQEMIQLSQDRVVLKITRPTKMQKAILKLWPAFTLSNQNISLPIKSYQFKTFNFRAPKFFFRLIRPLISSSYGERIFKW